MPYLLLDRAARDRLCYWWSAIERPDDIDPDMWGRLVTAREAALPFDVLVILSDTLGGWLCSDLRQASELATRNV